METAARSWRKSNDEEEEEEEENSTEGEEEEEEDEEGNANQEPTFSLPTFYQPLSTASMYAPPPLQAPYESFGFVEVGESPLKDGVYHLKRSASTVDLSAEGILNQQRNMEQRLEELCTELARLKERVALLELQEDHRWPVRYSKRLAMIANVTLGSYLFWTRFVNFFKQRRSYILQLLSGAVRLNINSYLPFSSSSPSSSASSSSSSSAASLLSSRKKHKRPLFGRNRLIHLLLPLIFSSSSSSLAPNKNAESERTRAKNIFNALLGQAALFALKGSWAYFFGAYLLTRHTMWKRYMGLLMTTLCSLWLQYLYLKSHFLASSSTSASSLPTSLLAPSSATTLSSSSLPSAFIPSPDSSFAPSVSSSPSSIPSSPSALIPPSSSSPSLLSPETYLWGSTSSSVFFNQKKKFQLWVLSLAVLLANLLFFSMSLKHLLDGPRGLTSSHDPFYSSKKVPTLFGLLRRSRQQQPTPSSSASTATPPIASAPLSSSMAPLSPLPSSSSPSLSARHHHHHRRARTIGSSFVFPPPSSPSPLSIDNNTQRFGSAMQRPPLHPLSLDTSSTAPASAPPSSHLTHSHSAPQLFHYPYSSSSLPSSNTLLFSSSSSTSIRPTTYLPPPSPSSTSSSSSSFLSPSTHRYSRSHSQQHKDKDTEEEEQ
ncbi:hypothetical protein QOT17_016886 [Balamuthia mandrillaris]